MKNLKRFLSVLLVLTMVFSLSVCAFADEAESEETEATVQQFENYCSIGDSVAVAWGYDDVPDTYPRIVKNAVGDTGAEKFTHHCGMRTDEVLIALDLLYSGMSASEIYASDNFYAVGGFNPQTAINEKASMQSDIMSADLITIEIGSNDVFYSAQLQSGIADALTGGLSTEEMTAVIENYISLLWNGYNSFCENFPKILDKIQEMKEGQEYTLVIVGTYNPVNELRISDSIDAPIGNAGSAVSAALNAKYKEYAEEYGFLYADITNVELGSMDSGLSIEGGVFADNYAASYATHPSYPNGYAYIARQILAQLPAEEAEPDCNIRVDLCAATEVKAVLVDGVLVDSSLYTFDASTHMLTVKYLLPTAKTITVTTGGSGAVSLSTYQLSYNLDSGYSAYLLYTTKDAANSAKVVFNNITSVAKTAFNGIKSLFSK